MAPTCFGHSCGHPKGGASWRIYYKSVWTNAQKYDTLLSFKIILKILKLKLKLKLK